jgi:hypothetical protein
MSRAAALTLASLPFVLTGACAPLPAEALFVLVRALLPDLEDVVS